MDQRPSEPKMIIGGRINDRFEKVPSDAEISFLHRVVY